MPIDLSQLPEGCPPLGTYYFYLTQGCNLACKHCWLAPVFQPNGGTGGHLDFELFAQAIAEALPLGLTHAKLTGGEPLLHPDFRRMVELLKAHDLGLTIETNGQLLSRELAEYLKTQSTLTMISVSLDGAEPETHDRFRGVRGSFEKACQAVHYLAEVGFHPQVIMTLHTENVQELEALVRLAVQLGAGSVKLNLVHSSGRGELMIKRNQVLEFQRMMELGKWVNTYLQPQVPIPIFYHWPMAFFSLRQLQSSAGHTCHLYTILGILPTGHMAMCGIGTQIPELCYGQLGQDRVVDVWSSHPMLVDMRKQVPGELEGICGDCILHRQCMGSCVAENYHLSGRLTAPYWFCQRADSAGLFPASRRRSSGPAHDRPGPTPS